MSRTERWSAAKEIAGEQAVSGRGRGVRLHSHRHWLCHTRRSHKLFSCLAPSKRRISIKALRTSLTRIPLPGNAGGAYRPTDVDIETTADTGGGYNLGWVAAGEWLKYTVNVTAAGNYNLEDSRRGERRGRHLPHRDKRRRSHWANHHPRDRWLAAVDQRDEAGIEPDPPARRSGVSSWTRLASLLSATSTSSA